jgi:hypothetical protein
MMSDPFRVLKQKLSRTVSQIQIVTAILILLLPCYSWFSFNFYLTKIQVPREWAQFQAQETQLIQALRDFKNNNQAYPENLSLLLPDYLNTPIWESGNWTYDYTLSEAGEFALLATIPQHWFGRPAGSTCHSQQNGPIDCQIYIVCGYLKGAEVQLRLIDPNQSLRQFWTNEQNSPCKNLTYHPN